MKRTRILAVVLTVVMLLAVMPFSAVSAAGNIWDGIVADFASGSGTEDDPYIITTGAELANLCHVDTTGLYFELANDIVLGDTSSANWYENATEWPYLEFYGNFDGKGYTVSGMCVNPEILDGDYEDVGLFSYAKGATIQNVNVTDSYIVGVEDVGGIVGEACDCYIYNCTFDGVVKSLSYEYTNDAGETVTSGGGYAGGIVGYAWSDDDAEDYIEACINYGDVYGDIYNIGGIVSGVWDYMYVVDCENYGDVCGGTYVGGIVGEAYGYWQEVDGELVKEYATIVSCVNKGTVSSHSSDSYYIGGITGYSSMAQIGDCYNFSDIYAYSEVGGIVGYAGDENAIAYCANYGEISGNYDVGGIIGESYGYITTLSDGTEEVFSTAVGYCVNHGDVVGVYDEEYDSQSYYIGGIIGDASYNTALYCYNYGDVSGYVAVGGIMGYISTEMYVLNCYNNADVIATDEYAGGIAGYVDSYDSVYFINCTNKGYIYSEFDVGGIVGYAYSSDAEIYIYGCQNKGAIEGIWCVGGIGGYVDIGIIEETLNDGHIIIDATGEYGDAYGGGILGESGAVTLKNCVSAGTVDTANAYCYGGLIGDIFSDHTITNCYYLDTTADIGVAAYYYSDESEMVLFTEEYEGAKGISAAEMKAQATFEGFDFENIWTMDAENPELVTAEKSILGDVNQDGEVDKKDYAIVKRACFGTAEFEIGQNLAADANGDGVVDKKDYALIKRACFGTAEIK